MKTSEANNINLLSFFELDAGVLVPAILTPSAIRFWQQFEANRQAQQLPELTNLLVGQIEPSLVESQLARAFVASEFIAKTCAIHPSFLIELLQDGQLFERLGDDAFTTFTAAITACTSDAALDKTLREFRNKSMIRIMWRDLNRCATMVETTGELSLFADTVIQATALYHYRALEKLYGTPIGKDSGLAQPFMVLGMGKLGAGELNVSSDIDLIFTFPESGDTASISDSIDTSKINSAQVSRSISNQEFFIKLGQKLIKSLDTVTADGFVFRVDMRLRPYGQSGSLALSFAGMEDYYQNQGRDWERYAMIKARTVAAVGGDTDYVKRIRGQLRTLLQPFTYRQYIDFSAIESLREMKGLIARQVQRKGMSLDVKLGEGGIREVEFVVQVFQLIRGGRDARLRKRKVIKLLPLLEQEGYLPAGAGSILLAAYEFLRNTEHALQGYQDRQTQALPTDEVGQLRLAWIMGFPDWNAFAAELGEHRQRVNNEFRAVIAAPDNSEVLNNNALVIWQSVWEASSLLQKVTAEDIQNLLVGQPVKDPEVLLDSLQQLRANRAVTNMQASSRTRLDAFIPRVLLALATQAQTDEAAHSELAPPITATFKRIVPLIESIARRSAYLVLLLENPTALQQLVKLCAASPWIADQLARYPALLDELLSPDRLYAPPDKAVLRDELRREVLRLTWDDLEGHMETLRYFRSAHALRVAASEVNGTLPLMKVSDYLTFIAEVILEHVLQLSWEYMVARHGMPTRADGSLAAEPDFIIVGYGKLGGIELGHGSDLDLVFIHNTEASLQTIGLPSSTDSNTGVIDNVTFYTRLGQRIIHVINTQTISGKLYEVDMRLRPSGNSGMLVSSLAAFKQYQQNEAWTWEHQALVRARVVAGNTELAAAFVAVRQQTLQRQPDAEKLRKEVSEMRSKMRAQLGTTGKARLQQPTLFNVKQDAGGIVDIEFMVQYAALAWAYKAPGIIQYTDNIRILEALEEAGLLPAESVAQLIAAYKAYRSTGHRLALQQQEAVLTGENHFVTEREQVTRLWQTLIDYDVPQL
ncbi:MAG: bifunctional [glutamate--ammonia ligase]-adenylyl-L-tyrosine phosphorylase/[glutamate--ammonia-ligase] adenylyltransferase [Pseudomonadota bacterium]